MLCLLGNCGMTTVLQLKIHIMPGTDGHAFFQIECINESLKASTIGGQHE